jgi:CubicO group peptidase (beta-lactamase class C family)
MYHPMYRKMLLVSDLDPSAAQTAPIAVDEAALRAVLYAAMEELGVPGAAVAVLSATGQISISLGVTSVENPLPITSSTRFRVASLTKSVLATALGRLHEQGVLSLSEPIRWYLPDLDLQDRLARDQVTLRDVLSHRGGWQDTLNAGRAASLEAAVRELASCAPLTPHGRQWSYCNSGYVLAGRVLEVRTGIPFERAIQQLVLDPVGMLDSTFDVGDMITRRTAIGHNLVAGRARVVRPWDDPGWSHPSVGLGTTLDDLARFVSLHVNGAYGRDGARVLEPETTALLHRPQTDDGMIALPWFHAEIDGVRLLTMGGGMLGCGTYLAMAPDLGLGIVILTNAAGHAFDRRVAAWILREALGIEDAVVPVELGFERLREFEGRYRGSYQELDVRADAGGLVLSATRTGIGVGGATGQPPVAGPRHVRFYADDRIVELGPDRSYVRGDFIRDADGRVALLRFPAVIHVRCD